MTDLNLPALKKLCDEATPGPYYVGHMSEEYDTLDVHESKDGLLVADTVRNADFQFWNAARTALPQLIEEVEATNRALKKAMDFSEKNQEENTALKAQVAIALDFMAKLRNDMGDDSLLGLLTREAMGKMGVKK